MLDDRIFGTMTVLANGSVLVTGGEPVGIPDVLTSVEVYDPNTGVWTEGADLPEPRFGHTATLLKDGRVLVVGGSSTDGPTAPLTTALLFDPAIGRWAATGSMSTPRMWHTANLLDDGTVLVVGSLSMHSPADTTGSAETFDPRTGAWTATAAMENPPRMGHTATRLADGSVLVVGGFDAVDRAMATAQLYDPSTRRWSPAGKLEAPRTDHVAVALNDGSVLVTGGVNDRGWISTAERYDPAGDRWSRTADPQLVRTRHSATLLADGRVLVVGGWDGGASTGLPETYDPASGTWSAGTETQPRRAHAAVLLGTGRVLVACGEVYRVDSRTSDLFDPGT